MAKEDEGKRDSRRRSDRRDDDSGGFSFKLPPIELPPIELPALAFPPDLRFRLPPPGDRWESDVTHRNLLVVAVVVDLLDATLVFVAGPPLLDWFRPVAGTVVALVLVGLPGLLYAWEGLAVLAGVGWLSAFPSATALVLARLLR